MAKVGKATMSYEELKGKLLQRFQNQGIFNEMKAQMRSKLVQELYQTVSLGTRDTPDGEAKGMLQEQVSNWLVCDHLQSQNYEFTLSTFLQESGMVKSPKKMLSTQDVLLLLGAPEHFTNITELGNSFLFEVVKNAIESQARSKKNNIAAQTWREQLRLIDESFEKQKDKAKDGDAYQMVLKEVEELRAHIDRELEVKTKILERRSVYGEKNLMKDESNGFKEKSNESTAYWKKTIEDDVTSKLALKEQHLKDWEERLKHISKSLEEKKDRESLRTQQFHEMLENENVHQMKMKLEALVNQLQILENEKCSLQKSLNEMADYKAIKAELSFSKQEANACMERLGCSQREWQVTKEKLERTIAEMMLKLSNPCSELLSAHQEIQKLQDSYKLNHSVAKKQQNSLEKQLEEIKLLYQRALLRNENQLNQLENQEHTIETLRQQLREVDVARMDQDRVPFVPRVSYPPGPHSSRYFEAPPMFGANPDSFVSSFHAPNFLLEAQQRISTMQAESEQLENRYKRFVETELLGAKTNSFGRASFGSTPDLYSHSQHSINVPMDASNYLKTGAHRTILRGSKHLQELSEEISDQYVKMADRNRRSLGNPLLQASMPVLPTTIPDHGPVDLSWTTRYKQPSLNNKPQLDVSADLNGDINAQKDKGTPEIVVSVVTESMEHKSDSMLPNDTKMDAEKASEQDDMNRSKHENVHDSIQSEIQKSSLFLLSHVEQETSVGELLESTYFKNELENSPYTTNHKATPNNGNLAIKPVTLVEKDQSDASKQNASKGEELSLTSHNSSKSNLPNTERIVPKPLESNLQNGEPVLGDAETSRANDVQKELCAPFQPNNHSTPVQEKVMQNRRSIEIEDSQSEDELQFSIGEQKSSANSPEDSVW